MTFNCLTRVVREHPGLGAGYERIRQSYAPSDGIEFDSPIGWKMIHGLLLPMGRICRCWPPPSETLQALARGRLMMERDAPCR